MRRLGLLLVVVAVIFAFDNVTACAQTNVTTTGTLTLGYPVVGDGTTTVVAVPVTVDATLQAGADMCAKINSSWTVLNGLSAAGGIVDARGFRGTQNCAGSMWSNVPTGNFAATLLTGAVNIVTSVSQVRPTNTVWWSSGHATTTPYNDTGTSMQPSNSFPTNTPIEQWGSTTAVFNIQDHNIRIACLPPSGTPITGSIGIQNKWAEEGSILDDVTIDGCMNAGLDIETSQAQNSGPYNVSVSMNSVTNTGAVAIRVGNASGSVLYPLRHISGTMNGGGATNEPLVGIAVDFASGIDLTDIHCEQFVTCVEIGANHATHSVLVQNLQCSGLTGKPVTTCLDISSFQASEGIVAENVFAAAGQYVTNVLVDHLTNGCTITDATDQDVSFYVRGSGNSAFAPGNPSCTNYITQPLVTP